MTESFVIEGGQPSQRAHQAAGNKNGALPILAALPARRTSRSRSANVPRIRDVETMLALLVDLGADAEWLGANEVRIHAAERRRRPTLDEDSAARIRASILLAGPLLARFGRAIVPPPGGDVIGRRRIDTHMHALAALGAEIVDRRRYELRADRPARARACSSTRRA